MTAKNNSPSKSLWLRSLKKDLADRPYNPVEIARVLAEGQRHFRMSADQLAQKILPLFGLPANRYCLDLYQSIGRLPTGLKKALAWGHLRTEMLPLLAKFSRVDRTYLWRLAQKYRLSASRFRQLLTWLDELRLGQPLKTNAANQLKPLLQELANSKLPPAGRGEKLVEAVRRLRYPRLSRLESRFAELVRKLKLPPGLTLRPADNWEGDFDLVLRFQNQDQLKILQAKIAELAGAPELDDFLQYL